MREDACSNVPEPVIPKRRRGYHPEHGLHPDVGDAQGGDADGRLHAAQQHQHGAPPARPSLHGTAYTALIIFTLDIKLVAMLQTAIDFKVCVMCVKFVVTSYRQILRYRTSPATLGRRTYPVLVLGTGRHRPIKSTSVTLTADIGKPRTTHTILNWPGTYKRKGDDISEDSYPNYFVNVSEDGHEGRRVTAE
ncbi:hypothetical protein EVAR_35712_1 [Eumeta japonica]|uniref:Uncharacterized protein n=1 Tax=Eumeta variegata TaxID=151549 RepID=A0A4C1VDS3_EUMVA|nr:hypothetical protein EVAR_35712_1 [Eumeta japonica]